VGAISGVTYGVNLGSQYLHIAWGRLDTYVEVDQVRYGIVSDFPIVENIASVFGVSSH
jgi:hypothetical protein